MYMPQTNTAAVSDITVHMQEPGRSEYRKQQWSEP